MVMEKRVKKVLEKTVYNIRRELYYIIYIYIGIHCKN